MVKHDFCDPSACTSKIHLHTHAKKKMIYLIRKYQRRQFKTQRNAADLFRPFLFDNMSFFLIINETKNLWHHIRHLFFNHHFCACNNRTSTMQLLPFYVFFCSFQAVVEVVSKTRKLIKISYTQQPRTEVVSKQ